jgi:triosephosphate isomerase
MIAFCEEVEKLAAAFFASSGVLLLDNVRFHKEEEKKDAELAKKLASVADLLCQRCFFGMAHI